MYCIDRDLLEYKRTRTGYLGSSYRYLVTGWLRVGCTALRAAGPLPKPCFKFGGTSINALGFASPQIAPKPSPPEKNPALLASSDQKWSQKHAPWICHS
jgi:hypothetical protein